jgi:hypothetical protein
MYEAEKSYEALPIFASLVLHHTVHGITKSREVFNENQQMQ